MQPRVLLDGLAMPESPRWHDGRLWFSNWGTRQARRPKPHLDARVERAHRRRRGTVYVNTINFDFAEFNEVLTSGKAPGKIALVTPDGEARDVANELAFPNGMVITADNRTLIVAESFAARLTAFDIADDGTSLRSSGAKSRVDGSRRERDRYSSSMRRPRPVSAGRNRWDAD